MEQPTIKKIQDFREGDFIRGKFAVRTKETPKEYRNKPGKYFFLGIGDKTGEISLKFWGRADEEPVTSLYNSLSVGDVIEIMGNVEMDRFDNTLTISMDEGTHPFRKCGENEYDPKEFLPTSERDIEEMMEEMHAQIGSVENEHLRALLDAFFTDENFTSDFKIAKSTKTCGCHELVFKCAAKYLSCFCVHLITRLMSCVDNIENQVSEYTSLSIYRLDVEIDSIVNLQMASLI